MTREAFGAEFLGADGFLNTPTYGLPPQFLVDALLDIIGRWQNGTMDVPSFDEQVRAGRAGYAALTGLPVDSVAMGGTVSSVLGLVAAAIPDGSRVGHPARGVHQHHVSVRGPGGPRSHRHRTARR